VSLTHLLVAVDCMHRVFVSGLIIRCAANDTVEQALGDNGNQRRWFR
jgi:hypothetical protein